ncbi:hypothetical protein [Streptomyces sp900116325]|uniref:hypothetical protein n=1 Tax=Streptomyces sp. 900116325 TaxID=3154295 RepID=UPI003324C9D0
MAILLAAAPSLTAYSTSYDDGDRPAAGKSRIATVDPAEDMAFRKTYTWPDGLKVTATEARLFTGLTADEGPADPKNYEFRAKLRLTYGGKAAADLSDIAAVVMGAPGQGSQRAGMIQYLPDTPTAAQAHTQARVVTKRAERGSGGSASFTRSARL